MTMEEVIAWDATAILQILDEDSMSLEDMINAIRHRATNILQTLEEGDPKD